MKIYFLSLFPNYYKPFKEESIIKKAIENKILDVEIINIRDYAFNRHKKVDDEIYGGGVGMLLKVEPIYQALQKTKGKKILLSPQGIILTQVKAKKLSQEKNLVFIAGRYEGFDERIRSFVDEEISIGDFVLTGGELASMVVADSIIRLIPHVIKEKSHLNDSFQKNLLDYPQYTRPSNFKGMKVPNILLSGHHQNIKNWRKKKQIEKTKKIRPDIFKKGKHD